MNISNNSFTLRDYLAFVFPGILLIGAYLLIYNEHWELIKQDKLLAGVVLLVGSYFLGYMSSVLSSRTLTKLIYWLVGDSFRTLLSEPEKNKFDTDFSDVLKEKLETYWGKKLSNSSESNLLYLCWRDIQTTDHKGMEYQFRLVSLWNFCESVLIPSLILSIIFAAQYNFMLSIISLSMFILMAISMIGKRKEFGKNVYKIWYVINKNV
jgi:hypothetical protein